MAIVSSIIDSQTVQVDGRLSVHEVHTDQIGAKHDHTWLAPAGTNLAAALAAYATQLAAVLMTGEIAANIADISVNGSLATPTLVYSVVADNFAALREAYRDANRVQAVMMGDFLSSLSDGALRTAFGFTTAQVTTLRTNKLTPAANLAAQIRATVGQ